MKKYKNNKRVTILKTLLISLLLFFLSIYLLKDIRINNRFFNMLRNVCINIEQTIFYPINYIEDKILMLKDRNNLYEENKMLKEELSFQNLIKIKNESLEEEITTLKDMLKLNEIYTDYNLVNATVISRNKLYWFNNLTIDKGLSSNIEEYLAVVNNNCLVGMTSNVYKDNTIVNLLTTSNKNTKISITIKDSNVHGLITGYDPNKDRLIITGITNYDKVKINDEVITSGYGKFPSNLLVGYVDEIVDDNYNISKIIYLKLACNINNLKYVTVLTR